jgi:predicted HTH domain antitoxin
LSQVILDIPDESLLSLKLSEQTIGGEIRMAAAMKLYEMDKLSSGEAARLAGVPRVVFLSKLADYGIDTFRYTDLNQETRLG